MQPDLNFPESLSLLKEAVTMRDDATFELLDELTLRLAKVKVADKVFYPSAVKIPTYPLNSANTAGLVTDKAYTNQILDREGISRTEGEYFFAEANSEKYNLPGLAAAQTFAKQIGYPVFVKPNRGSFGSQADVCFSADELAEQATAIATNDHIFHVQKVYNKREFRIFCIDGEIQFGYERKHPTVVGDGEKTIAEIVRDINFKTDYETKRINIDSFFLKQQLKSNSYTLDTVLKLGEELQVSAAANLARGGKVTNLITEEFSESLKALARQLHEIFNIRVYGVDFFASGFDREDVVVIEINQNPSLKGLTSVDREFALSVWHKILDKFASS